MAHSTSDATEIWTAGLDAVRAEPLVHRSVQIQNEALVINDHTWSRDAFDRVLLIGGGKAGTAMAKGLISAIGDWLPVSGWINVPEGTEVDLGDVTVHPARPAAVNEPTAAGVEGTMQILERVSQAGPRDLCVALISGGGSALLPAPADGVSLQDKQEVTRFLSGAGADITELNTVRKHLSRIKGGGLLRACSAAQMITLILSDVLGDPLDLIASGPTVADSSTPADALGVLRKLDPERVLPESIYRVLERGQQAETPGSNDGIESATRRLPITTNLVIGNNALAVDHAGIRAEQLGYNHVMHSAQRCEGSAEDVGRHLAEMAVGMLRPESDAHPTNCLITGGEPTVTLAPPDRRGKGGRNQQLILAAYDRLLEFGLSDTEWQRICLLSGGTDGEDGPTDAAGGMVDGRIHQLIQAGQFDVRDHLARNDAYTLLQSVGGLLMTGPTGTNVCDVRVALVK